jgi:hypothetical protein
MNYLINSTSFLLWLVQVCNLHHNVSTDSDAFKRSSRGYKPRPAKAFSRSNAPTAHIDAGNTQILRNILYASRK